MNARSLRLGLCALWFVGAFARLAHAQELSTTLLGPKNAVMPGAEVKIRLNVINAAATNAPWKFPRELAATLRSVGREIPVTLRLATTNTTDTIAPQSFARADYTLQLLPEIEGTAAIEANEMRGSAVLLRIQKPSDDVAVTPSTKDSLPPALSEVTKPAWKLQKFDPIDYFKSHLFPHEPFYFIAGPDTPNAKFQFSFKYQLIDDQSGLAQHVGLVTNMYFGYTQTGLWDWNHNSAPFEDSSYKPELMLQFSRLAHTGDDDWFRFDLQTGIMHESNGRDGDASRSLNITYLRPKLIFGYEDDWRFTFSPRVWFYMGDLSDNPDIARYRGHVDLRATLGAPGGLELAAYLRVGDSFDRGSVQLDLTYPLRQIRWAGFTWYLQAQYFNGYGESLLHYNERGDSYRIGFALYR